MKYLFFFSLFIFPAIVLPAQDVGYLLREAEQLEKDRKDDEALKKYQEALQLAPGDARALYKCSELSSVIGNRQADKKAKQEYFSAAQTYAQTALNNNADDADANFAMAMAMGRMALISSGKEKVQRVRDIKKYADQAIAIDPKNYRALHLLGKWNVEVSSLNLAEKTALKVVYGGLPSASIPTAIDYFEQVRKINPNFILNYLELAKAYKANGQSDKAIDILNRMLKLPPRNVDDPAYKTEGKALLESLL